MELGEGYWARTVWNATYVHLDVQHDPLVLLYMDAPNAVLAFVIGLRPVRRQNHSGWICDLATTHGWNKPTETHDIHKSTSKVIHKVCCFKTSFHQLRLSVRFTYTTKQVQKYIAFSEDEHVILWVIFNGDTIIRTVTDFLFMYYMVQPIH